jgi:hypothetical protein
MVSRWMEKWQVWEVGLRRLGWGSREKLGLRYSQACNSLRSYLQVGLVVFPSAGSSVHFAMAQTVASRPIMKTPRRAHLL